MAGYTYADFEKAAKDSGYYDRFSEYDRRLAQQYPEVGLTLLQYKMDYDAADTEAGRKDANQKANRLRGLYGGYSGGADGSKYYTLGEEKAPEAFRYRKAPTYAGSVYAEKQNGLLDALEGEPFRYEKEKDPAWAAYAKEYRREGRRAAEDALGRAAAATGGTPSSYAVTAATQAENVYAGALADKLPELASDAYDRWADERAETMKLADAYGKLAAQDEQRFRDERADYEADREFDYGVWLDAYEAEEKRQKERRDALMEALA